MKLSTNKVLIILSSLLSMAGTIFVILMIICTDGLIYGIQGEIAQAHEYNDIVNKALQLGQDPHAGSVVINNETIYMEYLDDDRWRKIIYSSIFGIIFSLFSLCMLWMIPCFFIQKSLQKFYNEIRSNDINNNLIKIPCAYQAGSINCLMPVKRWFLILKLYRCVRKICIQLNISQFSKTEKSSIRKLYFGIIACAIFLLIWRITTGEWLDIEFIAYLIGLIYFWITIIFCETQLKFNNTYKK